MRQASWIGLVSVLCLGLANGAPAQILLPASKDAGIQKAHGHQGNSSWGRLSLKFGGGLKFGLMAFEIPDDVDLGPDDVAMIRLRTDPSSGEFGQFGTWMIANLVACDAPEWVEGLWRRDSFYCLNRCRASGRQELFCPDGPEASVSWDCPIDPHIQSNSENCARSERWDGASDYIRRSPDFPDDFFKNAPLDPDAPAIHVIGNGEVLWLDVTEHVRTALACGDREPTWLLRPATKMGKRIKLFSREGLEQLCHCGEEELCDEVGGPVPPALYIGPLE